MKQRRLRRATATTLLGVALLWPGPASAADTPAAAPVETVVIKGATHPTATRVTSAPAESGLQVNVVPPTGAEEAREVAKENLDHGEVGAADAMLVPGQTGTSRTVIRVDDVLVQSRSTTSKACVQIGVVGRKGDCTEGNTPSPR